MRITVFTPTYNRGYRIGDLYQSLKQQTFHDFEWIVVDDGSTDHTEELFNRFLSEDCFFPIRYMKQKNGGKHRAINRGVSMAQGELFYIVDSDDYLPDRALEIIDSMEKTIPENEKSGFAGVCGQKGYSEEAPIGKSFDGDILDITTLQRPKYHVVGDKAEVIYTHLLRNYPFPEFEGENFVTECVVWDKVAANNYKFRFFNQIVMICEYLPDGLSAQGNSLFEKNPTGWGLYIYQCGLFGKTTGIAKWNEYLNYFYVMRNTLTFKQIAANLHINPMVLWFRLNGMRLFYKLYR